VIWQCAGINPDGTIAVVFDLPVSTINANQFSQPIAAITAKFHDVARLKIGSFFCGHG
jgi:hypothetical protein